MAWIRAHTLERFWVVETTKTILRPRSRKCADSRQRNRLAKKKRERGRPQGMTRKRRWRRRKSRKRCKGRNWRKRKIGRDKNRNKPGRDRPSNRRLSKRIRRRSKKNLTTLSEMVSKIE